MNEFLAHAAKIKFGDLPSWQKRGIGLYWEDHEMPGVNPKTGEHVIGLRRRIKRDFELPVKDAYDRFLRDLVRNAETPAIATLLVTIRSTCSQWQLERLVVSLNCQRQCFVVCRPVRMSFVLALL